MISGFESYFPLIELSESSIRTVLQAGTPPAFACQALQWIHLSTRELRNPALLIFIFCTGPTLRRINFFSFATDCISVLARGLAKLNSVTLCFVSATRSFLENVKNSFESSLIHRTEFRNRFMCLGEKLLSLRKIPGEKEDENTRFRQDKLA